MSEVPGRQQETGPTGPGTGLETRTAGHELGRRPAPGIDVRRERGLDLTPEEVAARRSNRRWMLGIAVPSVAVLVAALVATGVAAHNEPTAPHAAPPAGYRSVNDGYFSYAVPDAWSQNPAYTDAAGDVETSGASGWVGEHIAYRATAPVPGESRPASLDAFGLPRPEPYTLGPARPLSVSGATTAFVYDVTRPGGYRATAVDAWSARTGVEIWMLIHAPAAVTAEVLATLRS